MKTYSFGCGNTNEGAIGFCCDVRAKSKADAVKKLNKLIDDLSISVTDYISNDDENIQHARVYFGKVTLADIEDVYEDSEVI